MMKQEDVDEFKGMIDKNQETGNWQINTNFVTTHMRRIVFVFVVSALLIGVMIQAIVNMYGDLGNATALSIEIVFAILITLVVYAYSKRMDEENKKQQKIITNLVTEVKEIENKQQQMIEEQKKSLQHRKAIAYLEIDMKLQKIESKIRMLKHDLELLMENKVDDDWIKPTWDDFHKSRKQIITDLFNTKNNYADVVDPLTLETLNVIFRWNDDFVAFGDDKANYKLLESWENMIKQIQEFMAKDLEKSSS